MSRAWSQGNRVRLLENGETFFPAVLDAIDGAREEVMIETFILFEDKVGKRLHAALVAAAQRGVRVELSVDGYGSPDLSPAFISALTDAGVCLRVFDPKPRLFGFRTNLFRRLHRKIVVVDRQCAFVGGINFSADHLADYGDGAKQDYAVRIDGPVVAEIRAFAIAALLAPAAPRDWTRPADKAPAAVGNAEVRFVTRDNGGHLNDIEDQYLAGIRAAKDEILIANAYFLPGYRLLHALHRAASRGVRVSLILQGAPDMPMVANAGRRLYPYLIGGGVHIYEYCERPLHGKLAVIDDNWSTVGSSNLDPLSLSLNLEANVLIRDRAFNAVVRERLQQLMDVHCHRVRRQDLPPRTPLRTLWSLLVFHTVRHLPAWAGLWPAHTPHVTLLRPRRATPVQKQ
ncbi:cardiolipin synthase ClsB [Novilysobacter erysipheiresistens]|uniref:Cardiolipin synthase B n=1 Tax=Novilysobacter erysipheiresistens TaxID=1749332 RepID=A0ABU7YX32_9GAMM